MPTDAPELVILFSPMRPRSWRAIVLAHPPDMSMHGFDRQGVANDLPLPDFEDLVCRLSRVDGAPPFRLRGTSNGGVRLSLASSLVPAARAWLDEVLASGAKPPA